MDREQEEIQFLGFFSIMKESCNLIIRWKNIFSQIFFFLIIPLCCVYLSHIEISQILFTKIMQNENMLDAAPQGTEFRTTISKMLASEWTIFVLFKIVYFMFFIVLALLSTAAVVYTIACIYTAKEISFRNVMNVVPKVWKRLILTFFMNFVVVFSYNILGIAVLILGVVVFGSVEILVTIFVVVFLVVYSCGFLYITIIWHIAGVVSVLEDSYGMKALRKSQNLIKGKMGIVSAVFLVLGISFFGVEQLFKFLVVSSDDQQLWSRISIGIISLILLSISMLFGLIGQTITYFVCKSYHHENIDKSMLADHLGGYLGEYVPLKSKDVQMERYEP